MKLKEFWSRNNLDEMQQQTLLNIEARSFWLLWGNAAGGVDYSEPLRLYNAGNGCGMDCLYGGMCVHGRSLHPCGYLGQTLHRG